MVPEGWLPRLLMLAACPCPESHESVPRALASLIFILISSSQNAGRSNSMKIDNSSIERVEEFKYLGTTLTNQNSIEEEIKSRLKLGNACYYLVQNLLSSRLLSKN